MPLLSLRELNRATLERQLLLRRTRGGVLDTIEHLVGLQAQVPDDPYTALWSRLEDFQPEELGSLLERRLAVRMPLMRTTVHLVSAADAAGLRLLMQPVLERVLRSTQFGKDIAGMDVDPLLEAARRLVEERPRTKRELREQLGPLCPDRPANSLVYAVHYLLPLLQVPPRGVWGRRGEATWTTLRSWLAGGETGEAAALEEVVMRYLGAFGPASVADMRTWCGLTGLAEAFAGIQDRLLCFRSEDGRKLFDLPEAPRPPADVPAPVRFLPEYDNVLLSHADRSRFLAPRRGRPDLSAGLVSMVLVDGTTAAQWGVKAAGKSLQLVVEPFERLSNATRSELEAEAYRLAEFLGSARKGPLTVRIGSGK